MNYYYDPKTDFLFNKVFGKCKWITKSLLNSVLKLKKDNKISKVSYLSPILKLTDNERYSVIDIKCVNRKMEVFIVELRMYYSSSNLQKDFLLKYCELYKKIYEDNVINEEIKKVIMINLLDDIYYPISEKKNSFHDFRFSNDNDKNDVLSMFQIVFIELPKFSPEEFSKYKMLKLWLSFLTNFNEVTGNQNRGIPDELLLNSATNEAINMCKDLTDKEIEKYDIFWSYHRRPISA